MLFKSLLSRAIALPFSGWLCIVLLSLPLCLPADTNTNTPQVNAELSLELLEAKMKALDEKAELTPALKNKLQGLYNSSKDNLTALSASKAQTAQYQDDIHSTPLKIKAAQSDIAQFETRLKEPQTENLDPIPTDELEQRYILEQSKLSTLDDAIKQLDNERLTQNNRPALIREASLTAQHALESNQQKLATVLPSSTDPETALLNEATQWQLKTAINLLASQLKQYEFESLSHSIRSQWLDVKFEQLTLKRSLLEPVITAIDEQLALRRHKEASKVNEALYQTEKDIADKPAIIQKITRENIQYSRDLLTINIKIEQYESQKNVYVQNASAIKEDYKSAEKKISLAGLSPVLGKILHEQRRNLVFKEHFFFESETLQNEIANASLAQFKVEDTLKNLNDINAALNSLSKEQIDAQLPANQRLFIKAELRVLLNTQKDLLSKLSGVYLNYLRKLGDVDFARQQLFKDTNAYASFLDQRLLWVPSSPPINDEFVLQVYRSSKWLLAPSHWLRLTKDTAKTFIKHPFLGLTALFSLIALQLYRANITKFMQDINTQVGMPGIDHFNYTLKSLGYTLVLVAPFALFWYYLGWFLSEDMQLANFTKAVGTGLRSAASPLFFLLFYVHLFDKHGIARRHFSWRKLPTNLIRQQFALLTYIIVPMKFIIAMTAANENPEHTDTLGRIALIIILLAISYSLARLLTLKADIFPTRVNQNPQHWLNKLRFVWYPVVISIPLVIAGFAVSGYYLSALELQEKLFITLRIIFIALIAHELVIRWLSLVNRQLSQHNARLPAEPLVNATAPSHSSELVRTVNDERVDIHTVNAQTIQTLRVFIAISVLIAGWMVWKTILPAFSFLDEVVLWQQKVMHNDAEILQSTTLTNLIFSGIYSFIAFITVRNLSGLLELTLFRRFDMEAGSRYAINQLIKYLIMAIALIVVANELGGNWSQVQWLAAALSVGLGFGLQEIFANLVSGIILLFERPVRVGDTVTVSDVTGTINRIQMRATTLIDADQKELIVPNKTFITTQLINWTLTDPTTRIVIPIGIAYGSDIALVLRLIMETVKTIPQILETPEPTAALVGFGDNALNFTVHVFVGKLAERLLVTHELHCRLAKTFQEHGVSIPFPQQEVYLHTRTVNPGAH